FIRPDAAVLGPRFQFSPHGQSGADSAEARRPRARGGDEGAIGGSGVGGGGGGPGAACAAGEPS
ncbi:MAG: hypothetical protein AAF591_18365, partial [Verrucomicrobiota bacterium]